MDSLSERLAKEFPADKIKQRKGGRDKMLSYVSINDYASRVLDVVPEIAQFNTEIVEQAIRGPFNTGYRYKDKDGKWQNETVEQYSVIITLSVSIGGATRQGIGSDNIYTHSYNKWSGKVETMLDMDKACKTALAEAFKKACFYYGIGLHLWDDVAVSEQPSENYPVYDSPKAPADQSAIVSLSDEQKDTIKKSLSKLGFGRADIPGIVTEYMKEVHKQEVTGDPTCLVGATPDQTTKNIDGLIEYAQKITNAK